MKRTQPWTDCLGHKSSMDIASVISFFLLRPCYLAIMEWNFSTLIKRMFWSLGWPVWFRMQDQNSPAVTLMTEEEKDLGKTKIQVTDLVLGVRTTMPCLKEDWVKEKGSAAKWLTQDQLKKLKEMRWEWVFQVILG